MPIEAIRETLIEFQNQSNGGVSGLMSTRFSRGGVDDLLVRNAENEFPVIEAELFPELAGSAPSSLR